MDKKYSIRLEESYIKKIMKLNGIEDVEAVDEADVEWTIKLLLEQKIG